MNYDVVFWDIDGTLMYEDKLNSLNQERDYKYHNKEVEYFYRYEGLIKLMKEIPKKKQGIITNGSYEIQLKKLKFLKYYDLINSDLIFSPSSEAEILYEEYKRKKEINLFGKKYKLTGHRETDIYNLINRIYKPNIYMFERALKISGYKRENCILIADDWKDIKGANDSGFKSIFISNNNQNGDEFDFIENGIVNPDFIIKRDNIDNLSEIILKTNK